jgi:hypothetical protein
MVFLGAASLAPSALASETSARPSVVESGGMVRAGSSVNLPAAATASYPSCHSITYRGNAGYIAVQEKNHRLSWGIRMTPLKYSIGKWNVSTYLSGKKTSSGFNRTVKVGYVPHGSLTVPGNKIFHVQAKVVGPYGTFVNVPNACRT